MTLEAPLPRLSLDIEDLLCSWEETGRGPIFAMASDQCGWDDPTTNSCAQLDLSDVHASINTPRMGLITDTINTYLGQPPRQVGGFLFNQLANTPQPFGMWGSGLPPIKSPPSQYLNMTTAAAANGNWNSPSAFDMPSMGTPDSRNHNCGPPALGAAGLLADGGRQLSSKSSGCESWCTVPPGLSQLPQLPMMPFLPMGLPPLQPNMLAQLQHQNAIMSQQLCRMQQQCFPMEMVDSSSCNATPASGNGLLCGQLPFAPEHMLLRMQPMVELPTAAAPAPRTPAARNNRSAKSKAGPQSCCSSASTGLALAAAPTPAMPLSDDLVLSQPTVSDGQSSQLQLQQCNSGVSQLAAVLEPAQQKPSETAQQVAVKAEPRSDSRASPCSSVGVVAPPPPQLSPAEEGRKGSGTLARQASQLHATAAASSPDEFVRSRAEAVDRYRHKRARRAYTKKIRYQLRKINADRRPRIKGRFVKKEEMHLYAHLFPPCATADALEDACAGLGGALGQHAVGAGDQPLNEDDMLMMDDIDIDGLDMDGDWGL